MEYLPLFFLQNYVSLNHITSVKISENLICIGTQKGTILLFDGTTFKIVTQYQAHTNRVNDIWCMWGKAIVSCSTNTALFIKSLSNEFSDTKINISSTTNNENEAILCIYIIDGNCNPTAFDVLAGSSAGRLYNFKQNWLTSNTDRIHDKPGEGPVIATQIALGFLLWSTRESIYMIHFKRNQKICSICPPKRDSLVPESLYLSKEVIP